MIQSLLTRSLLVALCLFAAGGASAQSSYVVPMGRWTNLHPSNPPQTRNCQSTAYDAAHGYVLMFGGKSSSGGNVFGGNYGTYTWNGSDWVQRTTSQAPGPRFGAQMVYDAARRNIVLFGGTDGTTSYRDTWIWDGNDWTQIYTAHTPPARHDGGLAYDAPRGNVVLFGGADGGNLLNDTWTWNGSDWTQKNPANAPSGRVDFVFDYSKNNQAPLLFGGFVLGWGVNDSDNAQGTYLNDLWSWDGSNWTQLSTSGPLMSGITGGTDTTTGNLVVWGVAHYPPYDMVYFFWTGTQWVQTPSMLGPYWSLTDYGPYGLKADPIRWNTRAAFDQQAGSFLTFSGQTFDTMQDLNQTWSLSLPQPVDFGDVNVCPSGASTPAPCSRSITLRFGTSMPIGIAMDGLRYGDFSVSEGPCNRSPIAPNVGDGVYCDYTVTFRPGRAGQQRAAAVVGHDIFNPPSGIAYGAIYLRGNGLSPQVALGTRTEDPVGGGLTNPRTIHALGGSIYIADSAQNRVIKAPAGDPNCTQPSNCTSFSTGLNSPTDATVDGAGNLFILDSGNNRVLKQPSWTRTIGTVVYMPQEVAFTGLNSPRNMVIDGAGNVIISQQGNRTVIEIPWTVNGYAAPRAIATTATSGSSFMPAGVAVDAKGNVYIADQDQGNVVKVPRTAYGLGQPVNVITGVSRPQDLAVDSGGNLCVSDPVARQIVRYPWNGASFGAPVVLASTATNGSGFAPYGLSVDGGGNVYYTDPGRAMAARINLGITPAFTFNATPYGQTSTDSPKSFLVQNIGNQTLQMPVLAVNNPAVSSSFGIGSGTCPQVFPASSPATLAQGSLCSVPVSFRPDDGGNLSGLLNLVTNSGNAVAPSYSAATVQLAGMGTNRTTQFEVSLPASTPPGVPTTVTVKARDVLNALVTSYTGTVKFASTDAAAVLPAQYTFTTADAGVHTFSVTLNTIGIQTVTATDTIKTSATGTSGGISVVQAPAITSGNSTSFRVRVPYSFTVTATGFPAPTFTVSGTIPDGMGFADNHNGSAYLQGTPSTGTAGDYPLTITASNGIGANAVQSFTLSVADSSVFIVTTAVDTSTGTPANCPVGGGTAACSLRDALAAAQNVWPSSIYFSPTVFKAANTAAANTITLAYGTLQLPTYTYLIGPTSGSGSTLTNLVTISGNDTYALFVTGTNNGAMRLDNLNLTRGRDTANGGGAVRNSGTLTVTNCNFTLNGSTVNGGAISNSGALTVTGSTFSGNSAPGTQGGAIYDLGQATIVSSTFTGNSAMDGGAIFLEPLGNWVVIDNSTLTGNTASNTAGAVSNIPGPYLKAFNMPQFSSTLTLTGSLIAGNSAGLNHADVYVDTYFNSKYNTNIGGFLSDGGGNLYSTDAGGTSPIDPKLAPLANYGGPAPTLLPLPGSPAICTTPTATAIGNQVTDQRGFSRWTNYAGGAGCVDAGAVQTNYSSVQFTNVPGGGSYSASVGGAASPAPIVSITENGQNVGAVPLSLVFTGAGAATGLGPVTTVAGTGATFSAVSVNTAALGDTLSLSVPIAAVGKAVQPAPLTASAKLDVGALGVNVSTSPAGMNFTVDGLTYSSAQSFTWVSGTGHTLLANSPQTLSGNQYMFTGWSDGAPFNARSVTATSSVTSYVANFARAYRLDIAINNFGGGAVTAPSSLSDYYPAASTQTLTAVPNTGYYFAGWTGSAAIASPSSASTTIAMNANQSITANFAALAPAVTTHPLTQSVAAKTSVTLTAAATGSPTPTVQWQINTGGGFTNVGGATSTSLALGAVTVPMSGYQYRAVFTNTKGSATTNAATLTVTKAAPVLTWANPADITYGGALGSTQLNAAANVPGTFVYAPPAGTVLSVGNAQTLSVTFTPTDAVNYTPATRSVTMNVKAAATTPANLVVTTALARDSSTSEVVATVTVANSGGTAASTAKITTATLGGKATATTLPITLGNIAGGAKAVATLRFPSTAGTPGAAAVLSITGTFTGGSFGGNTRVTLP